MSDTEPEGSTEPRRGYSVDEDVDGRSSSSTVEAGGEGECEPRLLAAPCELMLPLRRIELEYGVARCEARVVDVERIELMLAALPR
jgi:hypothetical protein